jgi:hypothetical protein
VRRWTCRWPHARRREIGFRAECGEGGRLEPGILPRRSSCLQQFQSGLFYYVTRIRDRRFVAVDPERGLAFAFAFFDNGSGDARTGTLADGRKVVSGLSVPWTWQIASLQDRARQDRAGRIRAAPGSLRDGFRVEHLGGSDVQPPALVVAALRIFRFQVAVENCEMTKARRSWRECQCIRVR